MPKKISKSDQDVEQEKAGAAENAAVMHKLMHQPMRGQEPGDGCTVVMSNGDKWRGVYTSSGWDYGWEYHAGQPPMNLHEPFAIRRCKAHVASECWIKWVRQEPSGQWVFHSDATELMTSLEQMARGEGVVRVPKS